ncbi:MAG: ABC transporter permease [Acidobacteriaceae bacterium]|nr:ABC transporter permease [Acidobacteriaceae bacterium]
MFCLGLSVVTGFAFGFIPALQAARPDIAETLKAKAAGVSGSAAQMKFRKLLVTAQIGLSLLLLIGASLFIRSLVNLRAVDPGFKIENMVQFDVDLGSIGYKADRAHVFYNELETRLDHLSNVKAAGIATNPVLADSDWESTIRVSGHGGQPGPSDNAYIDRVSPGYFDALGIQLLAGRTFRDTDTVNSQKVVIVSESFAKHYFGNEQAIGQLIGRGFDPNAPKDMLIVGVVHDIDYQDLRQKHTRQLYLCAPQGMELYTTVYVRVQGTPRSVLASARKLVQSMEPKAPVLNLKTVQHQLDESLVTERMIALLSSGFSVVALLLAVVGLYGVMAYMVSQRAREIGIRVALGAMFGNVVWLVMREVMLLVLAGVSIAIPLSVALSHLVESELYGIRSTDAASITCASFVLAAIAIIAGFIPAQRAAAADPLQVLRYE